MFKGTDAFVLVFGLQAADQSHQRGLLGYCQQ